MTWALIFFAVGMALSAFFSGSETGMYRVPRIRLVLDALAGNRVARGLIWLLNNPALFVATVLVGNNIANYLVSLAIVLAVAAWLPAAGQTGELLAPMVLAPVVFVLGELLPKYLFFGAPHRLLKLFGGPFLLCTVLLFPFTIALGLLGRLLSLITGETPFRVRLGMARSELEQVLREGQEAGLLSGTQRVLAQNVFQIGNQPAIRFGVAPERLAIVDESEDWQGALAAARRTRHPIVLVRSGASPATSPVNGPASRGAVREDTTELHGPELHGPELHGPAPKTVTPKTAAPQTSNPKRLSSGGAPPEAQITGYYWYADLVTATRDAPPVQGSVLQASTVQKHFSVLLEMGETGSEVAVLLNRDLKPKAVVTRRQLLQPLLTQHSS